MNKIKPEHLPYYTYDDYRHWKGRWELIFGIPYSMLPMPSLYHQDISLNISTALVGSLKNCINCKASLPVDWKIKEDTILKPDLSVICKPYETGNYITKAPAVIFEILSPSSAKKDQSLKYEIYEREGVMYYVIVNPIKKVVEIFLMNAQGKYEKVKETTDEAFDFELEDCSFSLDFKEIW